MKTLFRLLVLAICARCFGADAANDIILVQRKSDNSGPVQRNVAPATSGLLGTDASKVPVAIPAGTGVIIALGANVGSAGAVVTNGGALGTPATGNLTNAVSTTSSAGTGGTGIATQAYGDIAARGTFVSSMGTPSQVSASPTWVSPVLEIYLSTEGGTPGTRTITLPAAASYSGQAIGIYVAVTATSSRHINFLTGAGAIAYLNGTIMASGHYMQLATPTAGNFMYLISEGGNWVSHGNAGTWTDAASP